MTNGAETGLGLDYAIVGKAFIGSGDATLHRLSVEKRNRDGQRRIDSTRPSDTGGR
jgi:hypothetical protein